MNFEEKLIRYIASKLLQKKYFCTYGHFPSEAKIASLVKRVLVKLEEKYRKLNHVRLKSESGLITPQIAEIVEKIKC